MTMPAEGVTFLTRELNDLAAAIMYVCTGVWGVWDCERHCMLGGEE